MAVGESLYEQLFQIGSVLRSDYKEEKVSTRLDFIDKCVLVNTRDRPEVIVVGAYIGLYELLELRGVQLHLAYLVYIEQVFGGEVEEVSAKSVYRKSVDKIAPDREIRAPAGGRERSSSSFLVEEVEAYASSLPRVFLGEHPLLWLYVTSQLTDESCFPAFGESGKKNFHKALHACTECFNSSHVFVVQVARVKEVIVLPRRNPDTLGNVML